MLGVGRNLLARAMVGAIVGTLAATAVAAKDCDCKKHKAGASGQGTCTLTESSSLCSINYTGSVSKSAVARGFTANDMKLAIENYGSKRDLSLTFRFLNNNSYSDIGEVDFRDIFINTVVLMSRSKKEVDKILGAAGIKKERFGRRSSERLRDLYKQFARTGCAEHEFRAVPFRYLIIHRDSKFNGSCAR